MVHRKHGGGPFILPKKIGKGLPGKGKGTVTTPLNQKEREKHLVGKQEPPGVKTMVNHRKLVF